MKAFIIVIKGTLSIISLASICLVLIATYPTVYFVVAMLMSFLLIGMNVVIWLDKSEPQ